MAFRRYASVTRPPEPMTLVANSPHEESLLLLFETYREPATARRLAAYLPRVAPFSAEELDTVVNAWLDDPQHTQAPAPGQLKALLEDHHRRVSPPPAAEGVPSWQRPPPTAEERPSMDEVRALVGGVLGGHPMPHPPGPTPLPPRAPAGEATPVRGAELDAYAVEILGKAIRARQYRHLTGEALGAIKRRLREARSREALEAIAAEIPEAASASR